MLPLPTRATFCHLDNIVDIIRHGKLCSDGARKPANLIQLKLNVERKLPPASKQRLKILKEIQVALRRTDTRTANKLYGPKEDNAKQKLNQIYSNLIQKYDFSANQVGNGIKAGGDMIAGRVYIDVYFSYKNKAKWHSTFAWIQDDDEQAPYFKVAIYQNSREDASLVDTCFQLQEEEQAIALYKQHLDRLIAK